MTARDVVEDNVWAITKQFSKDIGKIAKPYMQQLTAQLLGAGVPAQYLQYAFKFVFEEQRSWKIPTKDKHLLSALNGVVTGELLVPNYNRSQIPDQSYSGNINNALKATAKWARGRPANVLQNTYDRLTAKLAIKANKNMPEYSILDFLKEYRETIMEAPSLYPGGNRTAEILHTLLN